MVEVWKFVGLESAFDFNARSIEEAQARLQAHYPALNIVFLPTQGGKWATHSHKVNGRSTQWIAEWANE